MIILPLAPSSISGYVIANICYNIVILLMLKYGSAALLYVVRDDPIFIASRPTMEWPDALCVCRASR